MVHSSTPFENHYRLGCQALSAGDADTAFRHWHQCIPVLPAELGAYRRLAHAFKSIGQLTYAEALIRSALQKKPADRLLASDIANILLDRGEADNAINSMLILAKQAEQDQDLRQTRAFLSNTLMALEYSPTATPEQKKTLALQWAKLATAAVQTPELNPGAQNPDLSAEPNATKRPIRIGFISGDLCDHPVGFFLLPLLQHRTVDLWTPLVYDNGSRLDRTHAQLRANVPQSQWHTIDQLNDAEATRTLLADQLDCLIDLSGHTGRSRLHLMANRLAKKQWSWLGFSGTTGLASIDGIILDSTLSAQAADQFREPLLNLEPSRFCYRPAFAPAIAEPPSQTQGHITFGSFNNTAKYNPHLIAAWAALLHRVAESRLILKWRTFADTAFCNSILQQFSQHGIHPKRIEFRGFSTHRQMLDEYNEIDIALETFPFNGGLTSLEALWMGLPLVTLKGDTPISRQSASFLAALNKTTWIANSTEAYIQIAADLAGNADLLTRTRQAQRFEIMKSPLYDAHAFCNNFETLILQQIKGPAQKNEASPPPT